MQKEKVKFRRVYTKYNPQEYKGPSTEILDTVVELTPPKEDV